MANDKKFVVKNGVQAPNVNFIDSNGNNVITASMLTSDVLSFSGNTGQLFSISDSMTGVIFAVNDISGIPSIEVDDTGDIRLAELSGNVSIGTSLDTSKLFVQGNAVVNGTLGVGNTTVTGDLSVTGNTTLGDAATDNITINGNTITISANANIDAGTLFIDSFNNRVGVGKTTNTAYESTTKLNVYQPSGTAQIFNQLQLTNAGTPAVGDIVGIGFASGETTQYGVKGSIGFVRTASYGVGDITFYTNNVASTNTVSTSDERLRIASNGNIGIGNTSPVHKLSVNGTTYLGGNTTITGDLSVTGNTTLGDAATDNVTINANTITIAANSNIDAGTLYIDSLNNRIGINNTAPAQALSVSGQTYFDGNSTIANGHLSLSSSYAIRSPDNFAIYDTSSSINRFSYSTHNYYNSRSTGGHYFQINGASAVTITSGSNVGIGTITPAARLQVSGDVLFNNSTANVAYFASNGNVGIGNSTPAYRISTYSALQTQALFQSSDTASYIMLADSGSSSVTNQGFGSIGGHLIVRTGGSEKVRFDSGGNTGIGNTTPTDKLSVNGTTYLGGNTTIIGFANVSSVVNSASFTVGTTFTANATLVNAAALNVVNQINTATFYATTSANIASAVQANSTGLWTTGTVNAATLSVGTTFVANSLGVTTSNVSAQNLTLTGNLTVGGTTTTVSAQNLSVTDNMIYMNNGVDATITGLTANGTAIVFTANNNFDAGWDVVVTGVTPSAYNATYTNITAANSTTFTVSSTTTGAYTSGGTARGKTDTNPDIGFAAGYNDGTYKHSGFFRDATDDYFKPFVGYTPEPDASPFIDTTNTSFTLAGMHANDLRIGNTTVYATINSTSYSGTANNATNLGGSSLATIQGQITGNAATAYTNAVSYTDGKIATANSAITGNAATAYTNAVSYTDTKIGTANTAITGNAATAYTNATTFASNASNISTGSLAFARLPTVDSVANTSITLVPVANNVKTAYDAAITANTNAATALTAAGSAYSNAVTYTDGKILTANSAITGNAATAYTNATTFASNASNITTGTLPYAQIPANVINTTAAFTRTGITTFSANVVLGSSGLSSNGSFGTTGQVLHSNGTATYWAADDNTTYDLVAVANTAVNAGLLRLTDSSSSNDTITFTGTGTSNVSSNATHIIINSTDQYTGTVTSVATGNGLTGGAITSTGTVSILANTGIVANSTGAFVNSAYIATISANNATYLNGQPAAYYTNATNITTGTLPFAQLPAVYLGTTAIQSTSAAQAVSGITTLAAGNTTITGFANVSTSVNSASFTVGTTIVANTTLLYTAANVQVSTINATSFGVTLTSNTTTALITVGNSSVNSTVNSTTFSGTANNATNLGGSSLATIQGQITGNAATAYTNATTYASNASNISSGTLAAARLPALYLGTTAIQSTSAAQAVSGITTLAAGNTTITGFVNATSSVNSAVLSVGSSVIANTSGLFLSNTASAVSNSTTITSGQAVVYASQNGSRPYTAYDMNTSQPSLYETRFVNFATSANVASGMSGMGYWFGMGAGDVSSRGFSLLGTSSSGVWYKEQSVGTWYRLLDNTNAYTISGVHTHSANVAMANNYIIAPAFQAYSEYVSTNATATGAITLDLSTSNFFNLTLTGNITPTFSNAPSGRMFSFTFVAKQDATGGRTITWPTGTKWPGGVAPPATTTANAIDIWSVMTYDGGTTWIASLSVKNAS